MHLLNRQYVFLSLLLFGRRVRTSVADTSVVDLNADLMGLGRPNLDILDRQLLARLPSNGSL
jgi:hypothetical protein